MYSAVSRASEKQYGCRQNTICSLLLGPVYMKHLRQRYDDACDIVLIEKNGVTPKCVATPFWSDSIYSIDFNERELCHKRPRSDDADAWCKRALTQPYALVMDIMSFSTY